MKWFGVCSEMSSVCIGNSRAPVRNQRKEFTILMRHTGTECIHSATLTANTSTSMWLHSFSLTSWVTLLVYDISLLLRRTFVEKETNRFESDSSRSTDVWNPSQAELDQNRIGERQTHTLRNRMWLWSSVCSSGPYAMRITNISAKSTSLRMSQRMFGCVWVRSFVASVLFGVAHRHRRRQIIHPHFDCVCIKYTRYSQLATFCYRQAIALFSVTFFAAAAAAAAVIRVLIHNFCVWRKTPARSLIGCMSCEC